MNISYKWLKDYVDFNMSAEEVAAALTSVCPLAKVMRNSK